MSKNRKSKYILSGVLLALALFLTAVPAAKAEDSKEINHGNTVNPVVAPEPVAVATAVPEVVADNSNANANANNNTNKNNISINNVNNNTQSQNLKLELKMSESKEVEKQKAKERQAKNQAKKRIPVTGPNSLVIFGLTVALFLSAVLAGKAWQRYRLNY